MAIVIALVFDFSRVASRSCFIKLSISSTPSFVNI